MRCGVAFASLLLMRHSCLICVKEELADLRDEVLNLRGAVATMEKMLFNLVAKSDALEAKEQLLTGVAKYFEALRDCIDQETKRHSDALAMITYLQKGVGASFHNAVNETMEAAAENLTDSGEEQAPEPGAAVAGAGSSKASNAVNDFGPQVGGVPQQQAEATGSTSTADLDNWLKRLATDVLAPG